MRFSSNHNSPSKLEGVPVGGGRVSVNPHFYTPLWPKATSPKTGEELEMTRTPCAPYASRTI